MSTFSTPHIKDVLARLHLGAGHMYGINTDRLLVTAERLPELPGEGERKGWRPVLSWWMILDLIIIGLVLLLVADKERKRHQKRKQ